MTVEAIEHLCRADKTLGRLIKKVGACTMMRRPQARAVRGAGNSKHFQQLDRRQKRF